MYKAAALLLISTCFFADANATAPELLVIRQDNFAYDFVVQPNDFYVILAVEGKIAYWEALDLGDDAWGIRAWFGTRCPNGWLSTAELITLEEATIELPHRDINEYCTFIPIHYGGFDNVKIDSATTGWAGPEPDDSGGDRRASVTSLCSSGVATHNSNRGGTWLFHPCDAGSAP